MLFNSFTFLIFLPIVFVVYWLLQPAPLRYQNLLLLAAGYVFYGWWDVRFLALLFLSSSIDYVAGLALDREERPARRKAILLVSLSSNLGILGFFKYFDFFIHSMATLLGRFGIHGSEFTLRIVLPVGISFYTFQSMSYALEIYRRHLKPTRDYITFMAFVSFFPQLVAGPIGRAVNLLPQFLNRRTLDRNQARDGLRQMLWGFCKKVIVADNLAPHVAYIYEHYHTLPGITLFLGTFCFAIQIYCDFSGYSDIAIGCARLFGINLMRNFAFPYFSRDIAEFWRRWHISLSSWFRDYVYIPLGGNRASTGRQIFNLLTTFTLSGFWHGANWTYIVWGFLNGAYYIPLMLAKQNKRFTEIVAKGRTFPSPGEALGILVTFLLTLLAWVFFRSATLGDALAFLWRMVTTSWLAAPDGKMIVVLGFSVLVLLIEWLQRTEQHALTIGHWPAPARWGVYATLAVGILLFGNFGEVQFIYFQF